VNWQSLETKWLRDKGDNSMGINGIEIEIDFSSVWENIVNFGSQNPAIIAMQIFLGGGWVVFLLVFIYGLYTIFLEYQQGRYLSKWQHVILAIDIPKNNIQTPKAVESIFIALAGTQTSGNLVDIYWSGKLQESFSFEVVSLEGYIQFIVRTPVHFRDLIEAAIYANRIFRDKEELAFSKFQWFKSSPNPLPSTGTKIYAFDENRQNVIAAQKNAIIAQVKDLVFISRYSLDELDVKYDQHQFDRLILQVTLKDEDKINEIYYQASYILKPKGTLLLIGRSKLDISISEKFKLIREEEISRGNSGYKILVLEKK